MTTGDKRGIVKIIIKLDEIMLHRKIRLNELAARVGITEANLSILKTGKAKAVRFSTLCALCKELNCQPGDILEFQHTLTDSSDKNTYRE